MSDRKGDAGRSTHILLDYDYFSGLTTKCTKMHENEVEELTAEDTESTTEQRGRCKMEQPQVGPKGQEVGTTESKNTENTGSGDKQGNHGLHEYTRIEAEEAGRRLASQAGAEFLNSFTSELSRNCKNTSPTRSASNPASSAEKPRAAIGGLISDKSEVAKSLDSGRSAIDSDRRPNAGHSLKEWSGVFEGLSPSLLGSMQSKTPPARAPGVPALASSSVLIREIRGQNASSPATSYSLRAIAPEALRMPYFMHPSVYHKGLHKRVSATRNSLPVTSYSAEGASHSPPVTSYPPQRRRRFRIGFFGTHDPEFYSKHYHFPG
ncbi:MAG: hypothetical protein NTZ94_16590, partial [Verrucomicrobia bacterium]|nr:hypothetical protein [Verrucomicrobiota bacterium]